MAYIIVVTAVFLMGNVAFAQRPASKTPNKSTDYKLSSSINGMILYVGTPAEKAGKTGRKAVIVQPPKDGAKSPRKYIPLKIGDAVKKGQVLVQLDDTRAKRDVELMESKLIEAMFDKKRCEAGFQEAQAQYELSLELFEKRAISEEHFRLAKLTLARHKAEFEARNAMIKVAKIKLQQAELVLEYHSIRSPVTGTVVAIYRRQGEAAKRYSHLLLIRQNK